MPDLILELIPRLTRTPSHAAVLEVLGELERRTGWHADLWLADYRQSSLNALRSDEAVPVDSSWLGRAFAGQTVVREGEQTAFPVTARGNRLGVLAVSGDGLDTELLATLSTLLAQAVVAIGSTATVYEEPRRRRELTVAAELQWALLPGPSYADGDVTIAGLLEPAYSVAGDAFDWTRDPDSLHLAVLDGTGRGVPAALSTTLTLGALRNARFVTPSLSAQAALADQAVFAQYGGDAFTAALLLQLHVAQSRAIVVDAGSPALLRQRAGRVERVELEAQLPLGMFEETLYVEQEVDLEPGDRLLIVSDGIHGLALDGEGPMTRLERNLRESRLLSPAEVCRHVLRGLRASWGEEGPDDDAAVVCLDWHPQAYDVEAPAG